MLDCRVHVGLDAFLRRLGDMRRVLEVVSPLCRAGGSPEVVDREGVVTALGETKGELLVEAVEPPDVREDDDADYVGIVRGRLEGGKAVAVSRLELDVVVGDGRARDARDRRQGVEFEAHGLSLSAGSAAASRSRTILRPGRARGEWRSRRPAKRCSGR